jgi:hypothetical protein
MDEQLLTVPGKLSHFMMREYISPRNAYHVHDGHMAPFSMLCDYIEQEQSKYLETQKI